MAIYEFWLVKETNIDDVCALDIMPRLFDETLESKKLLFESVIEDNKVSVACAKCGHCVLLAMQNEQPPDSNACLTA